MFCNYIEMMPTFCILGLPKRSTLLFWSTYNQNQNEFFFCIWPLTFRFHTQRALPWRVKSFGVRQSKITKEPSLAGLGGKGLTRFKLIYFIIIILLNFLPGQGRLLKRVWVTVEHSLVFLRNVNNIIKTHSIHNFRREVGRRHCSSSAPPPLQLRAH